MTLLTLQLSPGWSLTWFQSLNPAVREACKLRPDLADAAVQWLVDRCDVDHAKIIAARIWAGMSSGHSAYEFDVGTNRDRIVETYYVDVDEVTYVAEEGMPF